MKKITVAILSIILVAMGSMLVFAQDGTGNKAGRHKFGKRGGHHRDGMMLRGLDLTDEQKAQLKTIRQASKDSTKSIRQQLKANRQKLQSLSESGTFNEAQVKAIAAEQGNLSAQLIVEKQRVKTQMLAILTPEQKAKMAEMKAQFKQKREERKQKRTDRRASKAESNNSTN